MIALSVAKLKMLSPESENFLLIKPEKERRKPFLWKVWINAEVSKYAKKARNVFL